MLKNSRKLKSVISEKYGKYVADLTVGYAFAVFEKSELTEDLWQYMEVETTARLEKYHDKFECEVANTCQECHEDYGYYLFHLIFEALEFYNSANTDFSYEELLEKLN